MSQFMLCVPEDPASVPSHVELRRIGPDESWLRDIARAVFPDASDVRVPQMVGGRSISDVFTDAHNAALNGRDFEATELASLLPEIMKNCQAIAIWWGDEWQDLPASRTEEHLLDEVRDQLKEPVGDVYLRWSRGR